MNYGDPDFNFETTVRTTPTACPHCQKKIDAASGPTTPKPGDITVCIGCRGICVFGENATLRLPTPLEELEALADVRVQTIRNAMLQIRARSN